MLPFPLGRGDNRIMAKRKRIVLVVVGLAFIGIGLFLLFYRPGPPAYEAIANGMTPQEVWDLLGREPVLDSEDDDVRTQIYRMSVMGPSGGQIFIVYRNGKVVDRGIVPPEDLTTQLWDWIESLWP